MRNVKPFYQLLGCCLLGLQLLCAVHLSAQSGYVATAGHRANGANNSYLQTRKPQDTNDKQTLIHVLKELNRKKGVYFLFSEASLGSRMVNAIKDSGASIEKILEDILTDSGLKYKKVSEKTFVILNEKEKYNKREEYNMADLDQSVQSAPDAGPVYELISGKVLTPDGSPIHGVSIVVRGKNKGTSTDEKGNFSIDVNKGDVLEFSYVGYVTQYFTIGDENNLSITLAVSNQQLNEVVVTALGIQRKSKSLTYSQEEVKGAALTAVPETNIMNSLQGKVAGLNTFRGSGGAGSSVNVVIRGSKSFGNNQPLYVVDGIPFQNNSPTQPAGIYNGAALPDAGDNLSQINSDDIESITVLKGAGATALYGSQGQNGVVLITTKKGRAGAISVDYSLNYNVDKKAYGPDLQYKYGQTTPGANFSWSTTKGNYQDPQDDFFVNGNTLTNSVSLKGGNSNNNSYLSFSNTHANNIYPNSNYNKNTINFRQSNTYFNGKLTADASVLFTEQHYKNPLSPGLYNNPITGLYLFPRGLDFNQFKENFEVFNEPKNYNLQSWWNIDWIANPSGGGGDDNQQNPFWILYRDVFTQKTDKVYSSLNLKYKFTDDLSLQLRGNLDKEYRTLESKLSSGTQTVLADPLGKYKLFKYENQSVYGDAILTYSRKFNDFGVTALAGTSITSINNYWQHFEGPLTLANVFTLANIKYANLTTEEHAYRKKRESVFGSLNLSYRDYLFLDVTARNDWSSALALLDGTPVKSYFYPSVGLSALMSDMVKLPDFISLWKLRSSYAIVGNDFDPYQTEFLYAFSNNQNGTTANTSVAPYPGTVLRPEKTHSLEFGTEFRLKNDLLFFDFTWFKINTKDQLIRTKPGAGVLESQWLINAGNIQNTGIELSIGTTPVKNRNFKWDVYGTLYTNKNVVKEFNGVDNVVRPIAGADNSNMTYFGIRKGLPFPTFFGKKFVRDGAGNVLIDTGANLGKPLYTLYNADTTGLGTAIPKSLIGIRNTITFNNSLSVSFLIDGRFGGQVMDVTQAILDEYGVSKASADARDNASSFMPVNAVYVGGGKITSIDPKTWYGAVAGRGGIAEYYMKSATNVRLRELSIAYILPRSISAKTNNIIKGITVGLNARNLFFFYKKADFDPDIAVGTTNGNQGYNAMTAPSTRSFGGSLKVSF